MPQASIYLDERARQQIRSARNQRQLTLGGLAELCGCSKAMLKSVESGARSPSTETLNTICEALDLQWELQSAAIFPRPPRTAKQRVVTSKKKGTG